MTLEEAKNAYAQKRGFTDWCRLTSRIYDWDPEAEVMEDHMEGVLEEYLKGVAGDIQIVIADLVKPYSKEISDYIRYDNFPDKYNEIESKIKL